MSRDPLNWIDEALSQLDSASLRRRRVTRQGPAGAETSLIGADQRLVNFASNDYLGLAGDVRLVAAAAQSAQQHGWGAGASPLIAGYVAPQAELEAALARWEGCPEALVFSSGYAANVGVITALVGRGDAVFSDELNHASIVDGCRLSRATTQIYRHLDLDDLARQLSAVGEFRRRLIVTDSLFSMHGDLAPLDELAELARSHGAMLMVDEAHATGVFGAHGRGWSEACGAEDGVHVRIGTLSKALGCSGGFVVGSQSLIDWLVNRARPYIFSTAGPPANAAAGCAALRIVAEEPQRRRVLLERAAWLTDALQTQGWNLGDSRSQIVPLFVGQPERALQLSAELRRRGLWVPAIRPPSVPEGKSCLRISLSYAHEEEHLARLVETLGELAAR